MSRLDAVFNSNAVKYTVLVIGVLAGLSTVFSRIFPDPKLTQAIAIMILAVVIAFFLFLLAMRIITWSDGEKTYKYSAKRYGIGYGSLEVSCILHLDGSAIIRRKLLVEAYSRINGLETSLFVPETSEPGSWNESINPRVEADAKDYIVSLGSVKTIEKKQFAQIVFAPELNEGKTLTFAMEQDVFPGVFATALSEKDVNKLKEKDYFGWNIDRPTRSLHLRVYFPEKMKPTVFGTLVQYNIAFSDIETARYQYEEQKRLKEARLVESDEGKPVLKLDIDYPMVGLMYILYWLPVPRKNDSPPAQQ
jgi:hypothetical protein